MAVWPCILQYTAIERRVIYRTKLGAAHPAELIQAIASKTSANPIVAGSLSIAARVSKRTVVSSSASLVSVSWYPCVFLNPPIKIDI